MDDSLGEVKASLPRRLTFNKDKIVKSLEKATTIPTPTPIPSQYQKIKEDLKGFLRFPDTNPLYQAGGSRRKTRRKTKKTNKKRKTKKRKTKKRKTKKRKTKKRKPSSSTKSSRKRRNN